MEGRDAMTPKPESETPKPPEMLACPFCGEGDFDTVGLKNHFTAGYCDAYEAVPSVAAELARYARNKIRRFR